ncbi:MAG: ABC transporter permease [Chloroflexi bacterium]|nr:MAG: ABC transporter permease [Chloroflexota bacterium]
MVTNDTIYDSASKISPAIDELREVFKYRELIYQLTRRDILTRYKRSVLGIAWTMLNPLGMMLVLTFAFSKIFRFETAGSYSTFVLSGLIVWNFFSQTTTACMNSLVWGGGLFQRIYIPRATFAISSMFTGVVNWMFSLVPLLAIFLVIEKRLPWTIITFPLVLALLFAFSLGVGLLLSAMGIYFPDVVEMYQIILAAWMYLTPIIYPETIVPEQLLWVFKLNPMYYYVKLFRFAVTDGILPPSADLLPAVAFSLVVLVVGWVIFSYKSKEFAYRA